MTRPPTRIEGSSFDEIRLSIVRNDSDNIYAASRLVCSSFGGCNVCCKVLILSVCAISVVVKIPQILLQASFLACTAEVYFWHRMPLQFHQLSGWDLLTTAKPSAAKVVSAPLAIRFSPQHRTWGLRGQRLIHVPWTHDDPIPVDLGDLDAWQVRADFQHAAGPEGLLDFLQATGVFCRDNESWTFNDLIHCQQALKYLLKVDPAKWRPLAVVFKSPRVYKAILSYHHFPVLFDWTKKGTHSATLTVNSTLGAMLVSVLVDHLTNSKYGYCARPDCRREYRITSKHPRIWCSEKCARVMVTRRLRQR
jgi:hypothetical protein